MPSLDARARLMELIAREPGASTNTAPSLKSRLSRFIPSGVPPIFAFAGAAAALVILVQDAVLVSVLSGKSKGADYQLASGKETKISAKGTFALIRFTSDAKADDIAAQLT